MKMYICDNCGGVMDEREATSFLPEIHDELPERPTEWVTEQRCIYCNSEDIEEAELCSFCGKYHKASEMSVYGVCKKCQVDVMANVKDSTDLLIGFALENADAFIEYVAETKEKENQEHCKKG